MISLISPSEVKNPTSIAIGSFDGLHAGHRKLIRSVVEENKISLTPVEPDLFWRGSLDDLPKINNSFINPS